MIKWEEKFESKIKVINNEAHQKADPAHDYLHFKRVSTIAKNLCEKEGGDINVVLPAAWLHDFVIIPKDDPRRSMASRLSSEKALIFLREINYPDKYFDDIAHAIEAHSFSAGITPRTLEARIVQDADRLDGLGAVGVARCFAVAGILGRPFYQLFDPNCLTREPNDGLYTLDHFYSKLFKLPDILLTEAGKVEGLKRVEFMKQFIREFTKEIT